MRIENKRNMSNLLRTELKKMDVELSQSEFQTLLKYCKDNNRIGENEYNCTYLDITLMVWLERHHRGSKNGIFRSDK